ncbi:hypothetical protein SUDANB96_06586 [Streptomyces sp. enrichment culture]
MLPRAGGGELTCLAAGRMRLQGAGPEGARPDSAAPAPSPRAGTEQLAGTGKAFLGLAPDAAANVIELADGAGVCVVQAGRGGGKVYVAPDRTVMFVPSGMHFYAELAAFLAGARTPGRGFEDRLQKVLQRVRSRAFGCMGLSALAPR